VEGSRIVAVTGYTGGEFVLTLIFSYLVVMILAIARWMRVLIDEARGEHVQRIRGVLSVVLIGVGGFIGLTVVYFFPVRIGVSFFLLGFCVAWLMRELVVIIRWWPFSIKDDVMEKKRFVQKVSEWMSGQ
jgi:hypothetical protein